MQSFGPDFGMPHTKALGNGLFELRAKAKEGIARVFFGLLEGQRVVMLHAIVKKSQKTPTKEMKLARKRLQEVQNRENTRRTSADDARKPNGPRRI